jgi:hypothetical protein
MNGLAQGHRRSLAVALFAVLPLAGCGSLDFSLKDAEWFNRPTMFSRSLSIETPPLSDARPVQTPDLISAEGYCVGMAAPADTNAMAASSQGASEPMQGNAGIAIGRTECEVTGEGGRRMTVLTYVRGPRPGIYRFADGRMISMERGAEPEPQPRGAKGRTKRQG